MKDLSIKKLYYSISEVSKITEVEQYVLRYWETEFDCLKPQKNRAGNRIYTNKDIQTILHIKGLLREKKYTIEGAKKIINSYIPDSEDKKIEKEIIHIEETVLPIFEEKLVEEKPDLKTDLSDIKKTLEDLISKL